MLVLLYFVTGASIAGAFLYRRGCCSREDLGEALAIVVFWPPMIAIGVLHYLLSRR